MPLVFKSVMLAFVLLISGTIHATTNDTIKPSHADSLKFRADVSNGQFSVKQLVIPGVLIGYGVAGLNSKWIGDTNKSVRNDLRNNTHTSVDEFTLYAPAASVFILNAAGVKGKHSFRQRAVIYATAALLSNGIVKTLKETTNVTRPNGLVHNSFPSGHTTAAFLGAEFLYQEYKDVSIWYGVAGYLVAASTAVMCLTNDRHWVMDIVAGAGIGILCTKAAYWLHPYIDALFFGKDAEKASALVMPFYNGQQFGGSFVYRF